MNRCLMRFGSAIAVLGGLAGHANAGLTTYLDLASFQAAAGATSVETFTSRPNDTTTGAYSGSFNGFTLTGDGNKNFVGVHNTGVASAGDDNPIPASFNLQNFFGWGNRSGGSIAPLNFAFNATTHSLGFDWFNTDDTDQYQLNVNGTTFTAPPFTTVNFAGQANAGFFGVVSSVPLTSVSISFDFGGGYLSDMGIDNVRVNAAQGPVGTPEPSTIASACLAGFVGLVVARRRRKVA